MHSRSGNAIIIVNGIKHTIFFDPGTTLLDILRDQLALMGTKNGCGEGHCGACTVIVDGEAVRACIYKASRIDGKQVETIEGVARDGVLHPLQQAFIEAGAVQCGFCTPGMIMAAKALLDKKTDPDDDDIRAAMKHNLCRCTGYSKILEAVHIAAGTAAKSDSRSQHAGSHIVGNGLPRTEATGRATGAEQYTADLQIPGMLQARVLRAAYPHARLLAVDVTDARHLPGVAAVLTAADVPGAKNHGVLAHDWPVLAYDKVRYVGDAVALVAAETEEQAEAALAAIRVEYEPLPVVTGPEEGLRPDAAKVHENGNLLKRIKFGKGDVAAGFAAADFIIQNTYTTPFSEHAFLEPEASVAVPDAATGGVTVYVGSQIPFEDRDQIAASLAMPVDLVRVVHMPTGGAFGGKEDVICQVHVALLARATGRPVRLVLSRRESMRTHPKRHATIITMKTGAMIDGRIVAHQARILGDTGAYASLGGPVMTRAATHSTGPYEVPNVDVDCYAVYTNNPPAGAFRGFGATQSQFAAESQMDLVAKALGMSPFEIRRINALRPGSLTATGQRLDESVGLLECLDKLEVAVQAAEAEEGPQEIPADIRRAWGVAAAYKNIGLGGGLADSGRAAVELKAGGRVIVKVGAADVGQGLHDVLRQIVAETLGVQVTEIDVILGDTDLTPNAGATTASRQTYVAGNAALMAAAQIRDGLRVTAAQALGCEPAAVSFTCGTANAPGNGRMLPWPELVSLAMRERGVLHAECTYTPPATVALGAEGPVHFAFGYGAQAAQVEVNTRTGKVRVLRVIAAQDAGKAINPLALEGQVEGGVMMGIGYALIENFVVQDGVVVTDTLAKYKVPTIMDAPRIDSILVEHPTRDGPFGAKGIGELTSMPTAPAVVNAVARAIGYRSYSLPIKREDIRQAVIWSREALSVLQPEMMEANL